MKVADYTRGEPDYADAFLSIPLGIPERHGVIVAQPNGIEMVRLCLSLLEGNRVAVLMDPKHRLNSLPIPDEYPDDIATVVFTSGTTGQSEAVCIRRKNWEANARALIKHHQLDSGSVIATPLPLFHCNAYGFAMFSTWKAGGKLVLLGQDISPINDERATILSLVPTLLIRYLQHYPDWKPPASLRYILSAAAPLPATLLVRTYQKWKLRVLQGYGLSESTNFSTTLPLDLTDDRYEEVMFPYPSIGTALEGVEIRIGEHDREGEEGELAIRSECNAWGYWPHPFESDWLLTGDLGYYKTLFGRRFYYLTGRKKEIIKRGGETLAPVAIEAEIAKLGLTCDYAVFGVPHGVYGEEVGIAVTQSVSLLIFDPLPYKIRPKTIRILTEIPRTATGKVRRNLLASMWPQ